MNLYLVLFPLQQYQTQRNRRDYVGQTENAHFGPMAERKITCLGRHSSLPSGRLICNLSCPRSKISSRTTAVKKTNKYIALTADFHFHPIAVETLDPINESACDFLRLLAKKISHLSGDEREAAFLSQCLSIVVQRLNSVACCSMTPSFATTVWSNGHSYHFLLIFSKSLGILDTEEKIITTLSVSTDFCFGSIL